MVREQPGRERPGHRSQQAHGADPHLAVQRPAPEVEPPRPREASGPALGRDAAAHKGGGDEVRLQVGVHEDVSEVRAVGGEKGKGEEQQEEVGVVGAADAGVEPDAVVVVLGDAGAAEGAVFAAGGFGAVTGAAGWHRGRGRGRGVGWVEERVVIGVGGHGEGVDGSRDGRGAGAGEVEEDVRDCRDEDD